jgi:hypothetical protein
MIQNMMYLLVSRHVDVYGNKAQKLVNEYKFKGTYTIEFKVNDLLDGINYYHLQSNHFKITKKMQILY